MYHYQSRIPFHEWGLVYENLSCCGMYLLFWYQWKKGEPEDLSKRLEMFHLPSVDKNSPKMKCVNNHTAEGRDGGLIMADISTNEGFATDSNGTPLHKSHPRFRYVTCSCWIRKVWRSNVFR